MSFIQISNTQYNYPMPHVGVYNNINIMPHNTYTRVAIGLALGSTRDDFITEYEEKYRFARDEPLTTSMTSLLNNTHLSKICISINDLARCIANPGINEVIALADYLEHQKHKNILEFIQCNIVDLLIGNKNIL